MKLSLIIIAIIFYQQFIFPQEISNVEFEAQKDKIIVYYDLTGDEDKEYEVTLLLRREEYSRFVFYPKNVEGDVGKGKFAGTKRKIVWDVNKDYHIDPEVEDYYFEIKVKELKVGISWYYYVGAALLGGGTAAAIILGKNKEKDTPVNKTPIGAPPVRP